MHQRIVWVHGIGDHRPGYSAMWQTAFNPYLDLPADAYIEVCWETVFDATRGTRSLHDNVALTPKEQQAEHQVRAELATILQARASALEQSAPRSRTRSSNDNIVEWSEVYGAPTTRGALDWLFKPDEVLGDFVKYLVSRNVRAAVKEKAKEQLRPLANSDQRIAIVAHSWGTVVAYDSLLDLERELPTAHIADLFTLGSPLWLVRRFLEERSGRKPNTLATWVNVHAAGDPVGSWLKPAFAVDQDLRVPAFGTAGPHSSYFVPGNLAVQRDIVARWITTPD
jgi:hypothetical protein